MIKIKTILLCCVFFEFNSICAGWKDWFSSSSITVQAISYAIYRWHNNAELIEQLKKTNYDIEQSKLKLDQAQALNSQANATLLGLVSGQIQLKSEITQQRKALDSLHAQQIKNIRVSSKNGQKAEDLAAIVESSNRELLVIKKTVAQIGSQQTQNAQSLASLETSVGDLAQHFDSYKQAIDVKMAENTLLQAQLNQSLIVAQDHQREISARIDQTQGYVLKIEKSLVGISSQQSVLKTILTSRASDDRSSAGLSNQKFSLMQGILKRSTS